MPQYLTHRNGIYTAVRVRYCNQSSSRQDRRHCQTGLALRKQVQQPDKVLDQGLGDTRRPCFTKVLDPGAKGGLVLCRSGNTVKLVSRFFLRAPHGQGSQVNLWVATTARQTKWAATRTWRSVRSAGPGYHPTKVGQRYQQPGGQPPQLQE